MKKLIIDCDIGVDDAQAVMVALAAPDVEILAISCSHGNSSLDNTLPNTLRILKLCDRLDIPVYKACSQPILAPKSDAGHYHGIDGLGYVPDVEPVRPELDLVQTKRAPEAIMDIVNANPGEVTFVALAPPTTLAVIVQLDPTFPEKLKSLYLMGGNYESRGNATPCEEFNFVTDPEAVHIVLERYTCPTYIASWEFSLRNTLPWSFVDEWLAVDTHKARFMKEISRFAMARDRPSKEEEELNPDKPGFNSCDTHAVAAAIDDNFIIESDEVAVTVDLHGKYTRGMMVVDYNGMLNKGHKVHIMKKVNLEMFKQMLMRAVS